MINFKKKETLKEDIERSYHVPGMPNYARRKRNAVFFGSASIKHELTKALICLLLNKYGDIKLSQLSLNAINTLSQSIEFDMKDFETNKAEFITECVPNKQPDKRRDVVNITNGTIYEIETNKKRAQRFKDDKDTDIIIVVEV